MLKKTFIILINFNFEDLKITPKIQEINNNNNLYGGSETNPEIEARIKQIREEFKSHRQNLQNFNNLQSYS